MQKILFSWLAMLQFAHAQITFNKVYNIDSGVEIGLSVIELSDGYLFYGEGKEYPELPLDRMMVLFKTDFEGNVLWHKKYGKEYETWASRSGNLLKLPYNNTMMFGYLKDYLSNNKISALLTKINEHGDTLWTKRFPGINNNYFLAGFRHTSAEFYFTGATMNMGDVDGDIWLVKTDSAGNILWQKKYGAGLLDEGYSIELTLNGNLLIGAGTQLNATTYKPYVIIADTSGNVIWSKQSYGTQQGSDCGARALTIDSNNYIISGCLDTAIGIPQYPLLYGKTNQIVKIDSSGNVIWRKVFDTTIDRAIRQRRFTSDGGIVFGGDIAENIGSPRGWFFKLDTDGNLIWERIINTPFNRTAAIYDFQETSDGGFICTGNPVGAYNNSDFWLLKLDANGCDTTNCIASVATLSKPKHEIHLFPNPATDKIFVCIKSSNRQHAFKEATLKLYDTSGKEVYNHVATLNIASYSEYYLNITNFQQGIYYYNISVANEIIGKGKLIKH